LAGIICCFCRIFAVHGDFQIGLGCFLLLPKLEGSKVICPQLYKPEWDNTTWRIMTLRKKSAFWWGQVPSSYKQSDLTLSFAWKYMSFSVTIFISVCISLTHTHKHTHTHAQGALNPGGKQQAEWFDSLFGAQSLPHPPALALFLLLTLSLSPSLPLSLPLSLTRTQTRTRTHTHTTDVILVVLCVDTVEHDAKAQSSGAKRLSTAWPPPAHI